MPDYDALRTDVIAHLDAYIAYSRDGKLGPHDAAIIAAMLADFCVTIDKVADEMDRRTR